MDYSLVICLATLAASILGSARCQNCQIDVVFVVDTSGSIKDTGPENWQLMLDFMKYVVDDLDIDTGSVRVGLVTFGNHAHVEFTLGDYTSRADVKEAIDKTFYYAGNTNLTGGLRLVRTVLLQPEAGDREKAPNIIIVITDGTPTVGRRFLHDEAGRIKLLGSRIIAVGVSDMVNMYLLERDVVSEPAFLNSFFVADFKQLAILVDSIAAKQCYFSDVHVSKLSCTSTLSVVFVLDLASGFHQNTDNYDNMHNFITHLMDKVTQLHADVSMGAVSLTGDVVLDLLETATGDPFERLESDLSDAVCMKYRLDNDNTNVIAALTKAKELLDTTSKDGKKVVILITDQHLGEVDASHMEEGAFSLITIGVGCDGPREPLQNESDHFYVRSYGKLGSTTNGIVQILCQDQG